MRWLTSAVLLLRAAGYLLRRTPDLSARKRPRLREKVEIEPDVSRAVSEQLAARDISHIRVLPAGDTASDTSAQLNAFPANGNFSANDLDCAQFGTLTATRHTPHRPHPT